MHSFCASWRKLPAMYLEIWIVIAGYLGCLVFRLHDFRCALGRARTDFLGPNTLTFTYRDLSL